MFDTDYRPKAPANNFCRHNKQNEDLTSQPKSFSEESHEESTHRHEVKGPSHPTCNVCHCECTIDDVGIHLFFADQPATRGEVREQTPVHAEVPRQRIYCAYEVGHNDQNHSWHVTNSILLLPAHPG